MGRVLASTQRWIGQTASIDALNCDIGADRDFGFHRDTSAPRPDEGRGAAATRLILVLRPIWWKSEMTKLSLRSWHLEQSQHRTNGVPKWTCRESRSVLHWGKVTPLHETVATA